jgi:hypothetical protein
VSKIRLLRVVLPVNLDGEGLPFFYTSENQEGLVRSAIFDSAMRSVVIILLDPAGDGCSRLTTGGNRTLDPLLRRQTQKHEVVGSSSSFLCLASQFCTVFGNVCSQVVPSFSHEPL